MPIRLLATIAVPLLACSGLSLLTGCAAFSAATAQHVQYDYPAWSDAPAPGTPVGALPAFVPHDATNVTLRTLPGNGAAIRFTSATPLDPTKCRAGALTGKPQINSNWWPTTKPPTQGTVCSSGWRLFELDGTTYGWTAQ